MEYNPLTNDGHCRDETANTFIRKETQERIALSVRLAKRVFKDYGFNVSGRITLIDRETGEIYK